MHAEPLVSVIVPAYNVEAFIAPCLSSILEQTDFHDFEVICVDDCSTDGTASIVEEFAKTDSRLIFLRNERNEGVSATRNKALEKACGKYIMFVDSDDRLAPDALSTCYALACEKNADAVCFNADIVFNDGQATPLHSWERGCALQALNKGYLSHVAYITNLWLIFCKRDLLLAANCRFSEKRVFEDWEYLWKFYAKVNNVCYIDRSLYYYTTEINKESLMKSFRERKWGFDLLLEAYKDSKVPLCEAGRWAEFEYVCLERTCEIFLHFFINTKKTWRDLELDMRYYSEFLHDASPIMMKKVISDAHGRVDSYIVNAVYRNSPKDQLFIWLLLFFVAGAGVRNDIHNCYQNLKAAYHSLGFNVKWVIALFKAICAGMRGCWKIFLNIIRKAIGR